MKRKQVMCLLMGICLLVSICGCGYTTKVVLPSGIQSIYVPNFKNEIPLERRYTYESGLEIDVTNGVIDRLIFDGNLKVEKKDEADAILLGTLTRYEQSSLRYNETEGVEQYRLYLACELILHNQKTDQVIWSEKNFTGRTEYFIEGGDAISERAAADLAIEDLAKKIVDRIVEDW